ncbi:MAG: DNA primase [Clostridium lundense]|nr:DNA primase [Clostridium lundense]
MWKGYIPTGGKDGKTPAEEYKNRTEFYNISDVQNLDSYGGVLADDLIQIDIDDKEQSDTLYKIVKDTNINTTILQTTRGKHFYFKNTDIDKRKQGYSTAIGIKIDVGLGSQNAVVPLKVKGKKRKLLKKNDELDALPVWLRPLSKKEINFATMQEGDGRNQTLFNYILMLQQNNLGKEEIRETIKIINKYILKEPLPEKEIETILRDESFLKESFYIKGKLQYEPLAKYLRDNENIIKINDNLHIYQDGVYTNDLNKIEKRLLKYINNSTKTPRGEVIRYLELLCPNKQLTSPKYVLFQNGVFDLEVKTLDEFNPRFIIKNKIPVAYNPSAYSDVADNTLNKICCNDKKLRLLIEEMIGYCLLRRNELGKAFILTGGGSNGKSTLLDVLEVMLGEDNISSVSLDELNERFKTFQLEGKLANIGDDISNKYIEDNSTFKKLVTGEKVNVERKGKDPFDFNNYSKLIFSANELPRINDLSDGLKRRLIFIPFNAKFSKRDKDYDPWIKDKLLTNESLEYMLKIALEGLDRILMNKEFTNCDACDEVWKEYEQVNNPVVAFLDEKEIDGQTVEDVYKQYQVWCIEAGLKSLSKNVFSREVKKHGFNSDEREYVNGKRTRIYRINNPS